ncbi:MAG: hypothetical protein AAF618_08655 [Pseudomonadota bacterium]
MKGDCGGAHAQVTVPRLALHDLEKLVEIGIGAVLPDIEADGLNMAGDAEGEHAIERGKKHEGQRAGEEEEGEDGGDLGHKLGYDSGAQGVRAEDRHGKHPPDPCEEVDGNGAHHIVDP